MSMAATSFSDLSAPAKAAAAAAARMRDPRLDFYRGIAMIIILFAHTPGNFFTSWIPARWGFSDATEIFVFCSGMASAIAFGRTFDRAGWLLGTGRVAYRVWQVYWAHIGMFFFIAMMLAFWDQQGWGDKNYVGTLNLVPFFEGVTRGGEIVSSTGDQLVGLFTLSYVPNYFDILPMYMIILVMMPFVIALSRISLGLLAAVLAAVWFFAQEGLLALFGAEPMALSFPAEPWSNRQWFFNPFGWQLVFFTGFAFMRGWIPAPPVRLWLILLAAVIVIANIPFSNIGIREFGFKWAQDWRIAYKPLIDKSDFGLLRYTHFLALAYLAWVAAGEHGHRLRSKSHSVAALVWTKVVTVTMKIGQQSLAVFVFSMAFARLTGFILDQIGRTVLSVTVMNLLGVAMLICVAYFVGWIKAQPWRAKPPSGARMREE